MPRRRHVLTEGEYYHVFNRGVGRIPIFEGKKTPGYFLNTLAYYRQVSPRMKYSRFKRKKEKAIESPYLVSIYAFSLMPSHFHFLLRQDYGNGTSIFMRRLGDSFSHYFNIKNNRKGSLFEGPFKSVRIETDSQLMHISRYIHLNATTDYIVEDPYDYYFSSYRDYIAKKRFPWLDTAFVMQYFKTKDKYKKFVLDNKDYQRSLDKIKHLTLA